MDWGQKIRDVIATGMKQKEVANALGASDSLVSEILSGQVKKMYWERGNALLKLHAARCQDPANV